MPYEIYMPIEEYKDSKYPGGAKYFVSNLGNIKNYKGEVMKSSNDGRGYMKIDLHKDGKRKTHKVHRLVLSTFKANPRNCSDVNHINEDPSDNRLNNLEWMTHKENINYGSRTEKCSKSVYCITNNTVYASACEAARKLNLNQSSITKCLKGKRKSTGGYQFKYFDKEVE